MIASTASTIGPSDDDGVVRLHHKAFGGTPSDLPSCNVNIVTSRNPPSKDGADLDRWHAHWSAVRVVVPCGRRALRKKPVQLPVYNETERFAL